MELKSHGYVVGSNSEWLDDLPAEGNDLDNLIKKARRHIEPTNPSAPRAAGAGLRPSNKFQTNLSNR